MPRLARLTFAVCLVGLPGAVDAATQPTGALLGFVRTPDGRAVPSLAVTVSGPSGARTVVTDRSGQYRVDRLAAGEYTVTTTLPGHRDVRLPVRVVAGIARVLDITLKPLAADPVSQARFAVGFGDQNTRGSRDD